MKRGETRLAADLDHVLDHTRGLWDELRGERIFITGGTGIFGCWLLESLCWAHDRLGLGAKVTVLTRDPGAFRAKAPHLAGHPAVTLHAGDARTFEFLRGSFAFLIHGANDASAAVKRNAPLRVLDTLVAGTRRVFDFALTAGVRKALLISSGSVYGPQPASLPRLTEEHVGGPDPLDGFSSCVSEGKRVSELLAALYGQQHGLDIRIARGFTFVGPYLPLDEHFAIGNFIRDAMAGGPIRVQGDGTPRRSYLYLADLAAWLWTILLRGRPLRPYNVGSEEGLSIEETARRVACCFPGCPPVRIGQPAVPGALVSAYVPDTLRARDELGLRPRIGFEEAIRRTVRWHRERAR